MAESRSVFKNPDGTWSDKRDGASRAAAKLPTQAEAQASARQHLVNAGGGELITHGVNGQIRAKDTVAPGNDPYPPKG